MKNGCKITACRTVLSTVWDLYSGDKTVIPFGTEAALQHRLGLSSRALLQAVGHDSKALNQHSPDDALSPLFPLGSCR